MNNNISALCSVLGVIKAPFVNLSDRDTDNSRNIWGECVGSNSYLKVSPQLIDCDMGQTWTWWLLDKELFDNLLKNGKIMEQGKFSYYPPPVLYSFFVAFSLTQRICRDIWLYRISQFILIAMYHHIFLWKDSPIRFPKIVTNILAKWVLYAKLVMSIYHLIHAQQFIPRNMYIYDKSPATLMCADNMCM